jgi:hypothetical protein
MPKGSTSRLRARGNSRRGLRDITPGLAETLQFLAGNPQALAALPEAERTVRTQQINAWESQRRARSEATRRGHANRRPKAVDFGDLTDEEAIHEVARRIVAGCDEVADDDAVFEQLVLDDLVRLELAIRDQAESLMRCSPKFRRQTERLRRWIEQELPQ